MCYVALQRLKENKLVVQHFKASHFRAPQTQFIALKLIHAVSLSSLMQINTNTDLLYENLITTSSPRCFDY